MRGLRSSTLISIGLLLILLAVVVFLLLPLPSCPVGGSSPACDRVSATLIGAALLLVVGAALTLWGSVRRWSGHHPQTPPEGSTVDVSTPLVDPGVAYLYRRPPTRP